MIIQLQCKTKGAIEKTGITPPPSMNTEQPFRPSLAKTVTLLNRGKTIRISMPTKVSDHRKKIRYNATFSEGNNLSEPSEGEQAPNAKFRPSFSPRRTYGNIKFLLEVMHKKVRAKTIENTFQHCNYKLDMSLEMNRGFKGSKLSDHSIFKNLTQNKLRAKSLQPKNNPKININSYTKPQIKPSTSQREPRQQNNQPFTPTGEPKPSPYKPGTANASLNIYRKKFKELKKKKIEEIGQPQIGFQLA